MDQYDDVEAENAEKKYMKKGKKRKSEDAEEENTREKKREKLPSMIKNKEKRSAIHAKLKHEKMLEKRKKIKARDATTKCALELGEEPPAKKVPRTIKNTREFDEMVCKLDDEENLGNPTSHKPELVLTNFTTHLCLRIGSLLRRRFHRLLRKTREFNETVCEPDDDEMLFSSLAYPMDLLPISSLPILYYARILSLSRF